MGNSSSNESEDDLSGTEFQDDEDSSSWTDGEADKEKPSSIDLSILFNNVALRESAAKLRQKDSSRDDISENILQQHHDHLIRWLEERQTRGEEVITLSQFCDFLLNRSVGRTECVQAFNQFDSEGEGIADIQMMLTNLKSSSGADLQKELSFIIRNMQACTLIPGFLDVYSDRQNVAQHGSRILNYILRNRCPSSSLTYPLLDGFVNVNNMRLSVLKSLFNKLRDSVCLQKNEENILKSGEELKPITKCFSSVEVSTNKADASRLTNGDPRTFWQSDGSAGSHWIRLRLRHNVVIKQLFISVVSSDQSYMPQLITISAGKSPANLREIKEIRIPNHMTGDILLLENAKVYYPIIQINIKRCHSDGCDTRIHGIKTLGYKIVSHPGVSVHDASAVWYLSVLAATATAYIPMAPQLRHAILDHSKTALSHMAPLSLSLTSSERPSYLSPLVLQEMDNFLHKIAVDVNGKIISDGLHVLLSFALARGHTASILKILALLQENLDVELPASSLIISMNEVKDTMLKRHCSPLQLTLAGCDGSQKDESSGCQNVLNGNWVSDLYLSADGKIKVNMFFRGSKLIQLTKIKIKVQKGVQGAKCGMVFLYDAIDDFNLTDHVKRFESYDTWTSFDYNYEGTSNTSGKLDDPVAFFTLEDDWDEVDVNLDKFYTSKYVLVKFLKPRQPTAERLGIVGIKFYGYHRKILYTEDLSKDKVSPFLEDLNKNSNLVYGKTMFLRTLSFLVDLAKDQIPIKTGSTAKVLSLDMSGVTVKAVWDLYVNIQDGNANWIILSQVLTLHLLHSLLPHIQEVISDDKESSANFFENLCSVVDSKLPGKHLSIIMAAKQTIIDGASIFFPDKEVRQKQLFSLMDSITTPSESKSVSLIFQSLCQFYSQVDPSGLLDLPASLTEEYDYTSVVAVLETLMTVAYKECISHMEGHLENNQLSHLSSLGCSLQNSYCSWCQHQLQLPTTNYNSKVYSMIVRYSYLLITKATELLSIILQKNKDVENTLISMENSFFTLTVRQLVLILTMMSDLLDSYTAVEFIKIFFPLSQELLAIYKAVPSLFHKIDSSKWQDMNSDAVILRTWEVESAHNYEHNQHFTQVFCCPGASSFTVEFDHRCETEKKYDYLEFTDSRGIKTRYDQKVGNDKWPLIASFKEGQRLQFLFHSDSSNSEWGYKFKVIAKGCPDIVLSWVFDLQLSVSKLLGRMCSVCLNAKCTVEVCSDKEADDSYSSELWHTLFRGGYMMGKLQRSLSGRHATSTIDSIANIILRDMVDRKSGISQWLLQKSQELSLRKPISLGNSPLDRTVIAIFAALLWHSQPLREEVEKLDMLGEDAKISKGISQAYLVAESMRNYLLDLKQKLAIAMEEMPKDLIGLENNNTVEDPIKMCEEKALFLLRFSGLSRIEPHIGGKICKNSRPIKMKNRRLSSSDHIRSRSDENGPFEKYTSFRLVLDFIKDANLSKTRVKELLRLRALQAQAVYSVYDFSAKFLEMMKEEHIFQIPNVLFLQEFFSQQECFPRHYADYLDGCGLELECKVRQSYCKLVRILMDAINVHNRSSLQTNVAVTYDYFEACLLHLLDINWQPYDLPFVSEINLPHFLMKITKATVMMRDSTIDKNSKSSELKEYSKFMKWLEECKDKFVQWYEAKSSASFEEKKEIQMFVAKFSDILDVEINCDGCGKILPGTRYRCLQCQDMDLCVTCYLGGVKPRGTHSDDHEIIHLAYKCDHCGALISGTRIHCTVCEDFDLCLGCYTEGYSPKRHSADHEVIEFPMVKLCTRNDSSCALLAYIHQHVWLLFTSLTLTLASVVHSSNQELDADYLLTASNLHSQCIELIMACLQQVPKGDPFATPQSLESIISNTEATFALHSQERIMGLLGAMIPPEDTIPAANIFNTDKFLTPLFFIARGITGHDVNTQHMSLALLGKLLTRTPPEICDSSVNCTYDTTLEGLAAGQVTIQFLFSFGAICLERSGLDWACCMVNILQKLALAGDWKDVVMLHLTDCITKLMKGVELSSIFALFVIAGFPQVLCTGSQVRYFENSEEARQGIVLKNFPERDNTIIIDVRSRKRKSIKNQYLECLPQDTGVLKKEHIQVFITVAKNGFRLINLGKVSVEQLWVLSLTLKALLATFKNYHEDAISCEISDEQFIQGLLALASKGTGYNLQWLLKDFEVFSLMLYTADNNKTSITEKKESFDSVDKSSVETSSELKGQDSFNGLEDAEKAYIQALHDYTHLPISILQALLEKSTSSNNNFTVEVYKKFLEQENVSSPEEIEKIAAKWQPKIKKPKLESIEDKAIDNGIQLFISSLGTDRQVDFVCQETSEEKQHLISGTDVDMKQELSKQRHEKSAQLFKKELEQHLKTDSRLCLWKVNFAMSVLYARMVLSALLANWSNSNPMISAKLLGCNLEAHIACVIDLLQRMETREIFQKMVKNVITYCHPDCLVPMSQAACQFMEEVNLCPHVIESEHNYCNDILVVDSYRIPGATYLTIKFDSRCSTEERCDELIMASSDDYKQDRHVFSGPSDRWKDFNIPGDTLYFKFKSDISNNDWGYKFTISGNRMGSRFETGYVILNSILSNPLIARLVPVSELWSCLVYVACKQTGLQRLKAIQLLLRIIQSQLNNEVFSERVDISQLKPLWWLYIQLEGIETSESASPITVPTVRALLELFLQAENLALEWGITSDYVIALHDPTSIKKVMSQALHNIALISFGIDYENKITQILQEKCSTVKYKRLSQFGFLNVQKDKNI